MITLYKIRYTYLKKNPASFVLGYLFIPIILITFFLPASIIYAIIQRNKPSYYSMIKPKNHYSNYLNPNNGYLQDFKNDLTNSAIIVNNITNGKKLSEFIKSQTNINLNYYLEENAINLKNYENLIIYTENDRKINFDLKIQDKPEFNFKIFNCFKICEFKNAFNYIYSFISKNKYYSPMANFQSLITKYLSSEKNIDYFTNITENSEIKIFGSLGRSDKYKNNATGDIYIGFIISLEMTLLSYYLTERMIEEKEKKLNDFLERQGISKSKYKLSWFVTYSLLGIIPFIAFMCFGGFFFIWRYHFFLINLVLYMLSVYSVMYFFFTIIPSLKKGSTIIKVFNFASTLLGAALSLRKTKRTVKIIFCFIPNINIYYTVSVFYRISDWKYKHYTNLLTRIKYISYLETTIFYVVELILYNCISLFIQSYKQSGLSFCLFIRSFFCKVSRNRQFQLNEPLTAGNEIGYSGEYETFHQNLSIIEQQKKNDNNCLKIVGVTKKFGQLKAVNNFNGELFTNEIFCLLGHNGAGKTTLVNIISGLMDPEEGDILLNGVSLITNKDIVYKNIGLCQQENILFEFLTVNEHLQFIYDIKGIQKNFMEIQELILNLDLSDVQFRLCRDLSGGQKRKVCIALALLSGGKIILLDEPTSGMDVIAKKKLWEFLKSYQKDKILLVTTHSLEEAEYIGTRIGIMTDGHFICSGTSTYLKSMYPCGININLIINSKIFNDDNKRIIFEKIKEYDSQAEIKIASKGVFSINIQQNNEHISEIFNYIEEIKEVYGIEDYIVGSASLEDVFLKINKKSNIKDMIYSSKTEENTNNMMLNRTKPAGFCPQLGSQLYRNLLPIGRNIILFIFEYLGSLACSYIFTIFFTDIYDKKSKYDDYYLYDKHSYIINNEYNKINSSIKNITINIFSGIFTNSKVDEGKIYANSEVKSFIQKRYVKEDNVEILVFSIVLGFIIFIGGLVFEKIKERKTKIKYLLYLSGCNMWSYWMAFFIIDFVKMILFSVFILLPLMLINRVGLYLFSVMPMMSLASIVFIYFFSSFMRDEDSGVKILLLSIVISAIVILFIYLLLSPLFEKSKFLREFFLDFMPKRFYFTLFDLTPLSSLAITIYRIIKSNAIYQDDDDDYYDDDRDEYYKPVSYIISGNINLLVNFIIYFSLMYLYEKRYLIKCCMSMQSDNSNFVFSEESVAEEFYAYNNLRNPVLVPQNYSQDNSNNMVNNVNPNDFMNNMNNNNLINNQNNNFNNSNNNIQNNINGQANINNNFNNINNLGNQNQNVNPMEINTNNNQNNINNNNINNNNINNNNNNPNDQINQINLDNQINQINRMYQNYNNALNDEQNNNNIGDVNPFIRNEIEKLHSQMGLTTRIEGLYKTFWHCCKKNVRVVHNLNLGLEPNEKFGLLGFNGSGKTTTFRAITNEILFEKGHITLFGYDTATQFEEIRPMIGYCPQENPLFDFMKVREIIAFYLNLKRSTETIESICSTFDLTKYLDTYCVNLSGGNKRKLTFAIALMNKPSLLLLDEPSTGVDPESRRIMWKNINALSNTGHQYNMILTTHSIEEAEILCDRVSWLRKGNFVCIGNPEQLKLTYSNGYKMHIKFIDSVLNRNDVATLTRKMVQGTYFEINNLVTGFGIYSNYIFNNPIIILFIRALLEVVNEIKPNTSMLNLLSIEKDFSFLIQVGITKEKQNVLFSQIFNLKNKNPKIAEISINLESLGNILTIFR